jgi:hypothetical protein
MTGISYRFLCADARELIERDRRQRRVLLDFFALLQDVLSRKSAVPDAPLFTEAEQEQRMHRLAERLTDEADLRKTALVNSEGAFAVEGAEAPRFPP